MQCEGTTCPCYEPSATRCSNSYNNELTLSTQRWLCCTCSLPKQNKKCSGHIETFCRIILKLGQNTVQTLRLGFGGILSLGRVYACSIYTVYIHTFQIGNLNQHQAFIHHISLINCEHLYIDCT
jgi:hypothetical protein